MHVARAIVKLHNCFKLRYKYFESFITVLSYVSGVIKVRIKHAATVAGICIVDCKSVKQLKSIILHTIPNSLVAKCFVFLKLNLDLLFIKVM